MVAGPNGSGKTTITDELSKKYPMGYILNPDRIESYIKKNRFFDLSLYKLKVNQKQFIKAIFFSLKKGVLLKYKSKKSLRNIRFENNKIYFNQVKIDSYIASFLTEYLRFLLIRSKQSFTLETVMSHESKIRDLKQAKVRGFRNYLYFVATLSPEINESRVKARVTKGGHPVSARKIKSRYYRSLNLLFKASQQAEKVYFIDNSSTKPELIAQEINKVVEVFSDDIPGWFAKYYFEKANLKSANN